MIDFPTQGQFRSPTFDVYKCTVFTSLTSHHDEFLNFLYQNVLINLEKFDFSSSILFCKVPN